MDDATAMADDVLLVRVTEAARRLGLGRTKTYELISDGRLEVVRIDGAVRVPVEAIETFVSACRLTAAEPRGYGDEVPGGRPIHPLR